MLHSRNTKYAKIRKPIRAISFLIFLAIFNVSLDQQPSFPNPNTGSSLIQDSPKEVIDQVWQIVYRDYLDSSGNYNEDKWINIRNKLLSNSYISTSESYEAIKGMLSILEDPYTRFMTPKEFNEMRIDTTGELSGVGIQLSLNEETNQLIVVSPIEDTPAFRAGVSPNDVIVSIDGKSTKGMPIENAVMLIRGKRGTIVNIVFLRNGELIETSLKRTRIEINSVDSRLNTTSDGYKVGYIRLKQFNANASKDIRKAIVRLESENPSGFILDLRSNPGGLLEASIDIARHWLNKGTIVSTETRSGIKDIRKANGTALTSKPLVVIVNEGSASASEILSGAIKDNKRGLLVGQRTFGKGLVQSVRGLSDGSGLTVTIARYLTPKGSDINKNGILPDVFAQFSIDDSRPLQLGDIGTDKDNQYKVAELTLVKLISNKTI